MNNFMNEVTNIIEKSFDVFVQGFGGTLLRDVVGSSPPFKNADYLFDKYNVIAELKCLEDDKLRDPKFIEKASSIHLEAFQKGHTKTVVFGTCRVNSDAFSLEYQERLVKLYEEPIRNAVKKANKQIRDTKKNLKRDSYTGVLMLINSGNTALNPVHVVQLLDRILSRKLYSSIDYAIFLTVNLRAKHPSLGGEHVAWIPLCKKKEGNETFNQFEAALRKSWQRHLEFNLGIPIPFLTVDDDFFRSLENRIN